MKRNAVFRGSATALITPFSDGRIDYRSLEKLIDFQIENNADALVICGTTGEASTLSEDEQKEIIRFSVKCVGGRIPMIAGTGKNDIRKAAEMSEYACDAGADALLIVTPYYNKATATGLTESYTKIADSVSKPIILYNVPSRTGCDIPLEVYRKLSEHKNIVAVKEASGNIGKILRISAKCGDGLDVYSGNDDNILPIMALGGIGVISVVGNIMPREMHKLCECYFQGDIHEALEIQKRIIPLVDILFSEINPIPIKTAVSILGYCREEFRLPMCKMSPLGKEKLIGVLSEYGLSNTF